ncbi:MAG: glycosyltransferase family 4 protein [Candidatus Kaiserbacteria bacterium]|nr:glycosyltransferase family 4 protein [Candidatus Kaiserbacteria bacterium]
MRPLRIAQLAPIVERVPPKMYGGTERVVHALTDELVRRGHEVTLFATGDSQTSARLSSVYPRGLREGKVRDLYGSNEYTLLHLGEAYSRQKEFDIIHDHLAPLSLPAANLAETPVVMTMHGAFNTVNKRLFQAMRKPHIVSISKAQVHGFGDLNHIGTVYHGLPLEGSPFHETAEEYLLFVARISMQKGTHIAIQVAQELDMPLILAGKVDAQDRPYFKEYVEPHLSEKIRLIGEVGDEERNELMSRARCFLHPVTWREPFGLAIIEAMACGCPVVAINLGSIPELIIDGTTGFVVSDTEEMIEAVERIGEISRAACRTHVLSRFSVAQMADGYEKIFAQVVEEK